MANVYDGGPIEMGARTTDGPDDASFLFGVADRTSQPGSLGAQASVGGASRILGADEDSLTASVRLDVGYSPSFFPGGDNPGGEASGSLDSVIEFVMPDDGVQWLYRMSLDTDIADAFTGESSFTLENLTRSVIFKIPNDIAPAVEFDFEAFAGDHIRLTTHISSSGSTGPSSLRRYSSDLRLDVIIPEPGTLALLLLGSILMRPVRRDRRATGRGALTATYQR